MTDHLDRYPGNLPHQLREHERHLDQQRANTTPNTTAVGPVPTPLGVHGNANTPRRSRWRLWLLPSVYLVLSTGTCVDLVLSPDSASSGGPVVAGQGLAVTPVSHARSAR